MRIVLDTNVLVAAFITRGTCADLVEHCVLNYDLVTSRFILEEFRWVLTEKFGISRADAAGAVKLLKSYMGTVMPVPLGERVSRDESDDAILATAVAGKCGVIVSGDKDIVILKEYMGIAILAPDDFWKFEVNQGTAGASKKDARRRGR